MDKMQVSSKTQDFEIGENRLFTAFLNIIF